MEPGPKQAHSRWWLVAGFAVAFVATVLIGYWLAFSTFQDYDDEGAHLQGVRAFLEGAPLYTKVYAFHGPFNYLLVSALYRFSLSAATTDGARFIVIAVWCGSALAVGLAVRHITGSALLGIAGQIAWFWASRGLINEPAHPVLSVTLLLAVAACALAWGLPDRPTRAMVVVGLATGALVMTKINVGGLMAIAVVVAAGLVLPRFAGLRRVLAGAAVVLPFALMGADLGTEAWLSLAIVVGGSIAAIAIACTATALEPDGDSDVGPIVGFLVGAAAAALGCIVILLVTGSNLGDVVHGIFITPTSQPGAFSIPLPVGPNAITVAVLAVAAAFLGNRLLRSGRVSRVGSGVMRLVAGLAILCAVAEVPGLSLTAQGSPLVVPLLLAWVAVLPLTDVRPRVWEQFMRVCVTTIAVLQVLHIYPVAGSQRSPASVMFVLVGAVCLRDGLRELPLERVRMEWLRGVLGATAAAVLALALLLPQAISTGQDYNARFALPFKGASRIHLDAGRAVDYTRLVYAIRRECDALVGEPGFYSLQSWAGLPPVNDLIINNWVPLLNAAQQRTIVSALLSHRRPCALYNAAVEGFWSQGQPIPQRPLVRLIKGMPTVATIGPFELRVPAARAASVRRDLGS